MAPCVGYRQDSSEPLMQAKDRERLVKLLNMTHSASDGEALAAIRKCNELLRQHKLSWIDVWPSSARIGRSARLAKVQTPSEEPLGPFGLHHHGRSKRRSTISRC